MNEVVSELTYKLKEELKNSIEYKQLKQFEKELENNKDIQLLVYKKDMLIVKLEDIIKPAESLPEPPKEVIVDVNSIPEINMTDTNQNTAASGNTFDDQEVDIVATPDAAKGNTNVDQETSVDADTVNKILNEQNNTSQA